MAGLNKLQIGVFGRRSEDSSPWATAMVASYRILNPEQAVWLDANPSIETELYNRFLGLYATFSAYTDATFIYLFQVSGNTVGRNIVKSGDDLRWDMAGTVYVQDFLPVATMANNSIITVTSTDGWGGVTDFNIDTNGLKGTCPKFNLPNTTIFRIDTNSFSGTCPNFNLPSVTIFEIHTNSFSGTCPNFSLPSVTNFYIYTNDFSGTCPNFSLPNVINFIINGNDFSGTCPAFSFPNATTFRIDTNSFSGTCPNFNLPSVTNFRLFSNSFSGACPNFNFPNLVTFYIYSNSFTSIAGFTSVNILLGDIRANINALNQASVDGILAAAVAANKTTGTRLLYLNGGTNSTPSASGLTDKATLESRGWTVLIN